MKTIIFTILLFASVVRADILATVSAQGMLIKDRIEVIVFEDPSVKGIACYTTRYVRTMTLKDDSGSSSLACRKVGPISGEFKDQKDVFSQNKAFLSLYKTTMVDRFWDKEHNTLVYLSYTKSWGKGQNAENSISVVPVKE